MRHNQRVQDALLGAVFAVVAVLEIWVPFSSAVGTGSQGWSTVVAVSLGAAVALRRRWPLGVAAVVLLGWPVLNELDTLLVLFWGQFVPLLVIVYSVARHASNRRGLAGAGLAAGTLLYIDLRVPELQQPGEITFHWMVMTIAWVVGHTLRARELRAAASEQRAVGAEQAGRERAIEAVAAERARIARELHDVVAHAVSVMVVQAGAAEQVVDVDPARARQALAAIRTTGSDALTEMRRLVGILRETDEPATGAVGSLAPQPGVASLQVVLEQARAAGLDVALTVEGDERTLPAGLDLTVYRVVQEALTNAIRHSGARRVGVRLRYGADTLDVEVQDDGRGAATRGHGNGLLGMQERVALYGGRLDTASEPGAGFVVRAALPVPLPLGASVLPS
ncbi:MAG: sensor histidine kinase [Actinomycetes bacterium]